MNNKIKIGIIGCSTIAKASTIPAILKSTNANLEFIGSTSERKAKEYSLEFGVKKFGSYEDVLNDPSIDVVYISTPIGTHEEWVLKAANARKHILCEKSSTTSYSSAKKMIDVCTKNNVRIMEGFMFRFHPSHKKVREIIKKGDLGKLFTFYGMYGFPPIEKDNIRYDKSLGGGILNDAGCYPICASRILFESEPIGIFCRLSLDKEFQVDTKASIMMNFTQERSSQSVLGYDLFYQSVYSLWGNKGFLNLSRAYNVPPDMPVSLNIKTNDFEKKLSIEPVDHFELMIDSFVRELRVPDTSSFSFEKDLLNQARVMEAARISHQEKRYVEINEIQ
ncbi:Gfo/Idh/MocA family protein [Nitrosopumilus ureiphilus]|uniref:Dehydrogenase n=1 Tax=Nitrosopumilus ureiphilus TaxID=1470067 RepID=A0A7D5R660_9ARCH|nr:Gfo/Idh/MocA family oxidoreductase [Nitrosopumilus ureiphilus]QLH05799.1 dehydrogenase [Nitrosopumilus ureiphilus]